ncbi:DNA polymerase-4 [Dyadobacter jejuensis]|uniref:DNA polymerase IV n=1 Tax=Dyadobacter jejuensis TaxID=1082580 RepID=A0A316ANG5_9BACT|nr:DNA polymerase IV [Dyadobacter jejuensis]PWJ59086.1 DNA polymerase-4 [Dyadobacter jejuensis]
MSTQNTPPLRKIIHIDMDAFFASVEQRDHPQWKGQPIAVGGSPTGRGVVAAASYEARKYGVRSAMPSAQALKKCPHIIFVKPRFEIYKSVSLQIREIFGRYTDLIEPLSLDEAYLDVTIDKKGIGSAIDIAQEIKKAIKSELGLTASAGVSINKFVAKIASDVNKPDGITFIGPSKVEAFLDQLPIEKFYGVGKVTASKMKLMNIHKGSDLRGLSIEALQQNFGKLGRFLFAVIRAEDHRPVQTQRLVKSLGAEDTFGKDLVHLEDMVAELETLAQTVSDRLSKKKLQGRTLTLKVKFSDFTQITRNRSVNYPLASATQLRDIATELLGNIDFEDRPVRLLGITLSNFNDPTPRPKADPDQLELFNPD